MANRQPANEVANAAWRRRGDESAAARLQHHGWVCIPPEGVEALPPGLATTARDRLAELLHERLRARTRIYC